MRENERNTQLKKEQGNDMEPIEKRIAGEETDWRHVGESFAIKPKCVLWLRKTSD
jgi:hypothetical protein